MSSPDEQSIRRLAEAYTAAWCSQNPASVAAFYEETGSLTVNADPPDVGREAITQAAQRFMTAFPDMKVVMDGVHPQADGVIYHWTLTGTNSGPDGTGRSVHISGFEVWEISANGLIASSQGHFDTDEYRRQLEN